MSSSYAGVVYPRRGLSQSPKHMPIKGTSDDPNSVQLLWRQHLRAVTDCSEKSRVLCKASSPLVAEPHHQSYFRGCPVDRILKEELAQQGRRGQDSGGLEATLKAALQKILKL